MTQLQEQVLTEIVAAAKARGLKPCQGASYRNSKGDICEAEDPDLAACCAWGALQMFRESGLNGLGLGFMPGDIAAGNDSVGRPYRMRYATSIDAVDFGVAFQEMMSDGP